MKTSQIVSALAARGIDCQVVAAKQYKSYADWYAAIKSLPAAEIEKQRNILIEALDERSNPLEVAKYFLESAQKDFKRAYELKVPPTDHRVRNAKIQAVLLNEIIKSKRYMSEKSKKSKVSKMGDVDLWTLTRSEFKDYVTHSDSKSIKIKDSMGRESRLRPDDYEYVLIRAVQSNKKLPKKVLTPDVKSMFAGHATRIRMEISALTEALQAKQKPRGYKTFKAVRERIDNLEKLLKLYESVK